jgi:hypothetical protein
MTKARIASALSVGLLLAAFGCASPLEAIPKAQVQLVGQDERVAAKAGPAARLIETPRFRALKEEVASTPQVAVLKSPQMLKGDPTIGSLPAGTAIGFQHNGYPKWFALGAEAMILDRKFPANSLITYAGYRFADLVLGGPVRYGDLELRAGDQILDWEEHVAFPTRVRLNGPHTFEGKAYADGDEVTWRRSGEILAVRSAAQQDADSKKRAAEFERQRKVREQACAFKCAGQALRADCMSRCMW